MYDAKGGYFRTKFSSATLIHSYFSSLTNRMVILHAAFCHCGLLPNMMVLNWRAEPLIPGSQQELCRISELFMLHVSIFIEILTLDVWWIFQLHPLSIVGQNTPFTLIGRWGKLVLKYSAPSTIFFHPPSPFHCISVLSCSQQFFHCIIQVGQKSCVNAGEVNKNFWYDEIQFDIKKLHQPDTMWWGTKYHTFANDSCETALNFFGCE